jgi:hypothetical protein
MEKLNNTIKLGDYDTTINVIGGLRDCSVIYKAIESHFNEEDTLNDLISGRNEFNLRTERSRTRIERAIKRTFLQFNNQEHKDLIQRFFQHKISLPEKELILFWQFALSNRLFREISSQVFIKAYFSGRISLSKDDIIAYLKEFLTQSKQLKLDWSESTINSLSTKYLNLMTKLNFLEGVRTKSFRHIKTSGESLVLFLYFAKLYDPENSNILQNDMLPLSFVAPEDIKDRLKKLSLKGFFNMNFNGVIMNIELTHNFKGICDALYH